MEGIIKTVNWFQIHQKDQDYVIIRVTIYLMMWYPLFVLLQTQYTGIKLYGELVTKNN